MYLEKTLFNPSELLLIFIMLLVVIVVIQLIISRSIMEVIITYSLLSLITGLIYLLLDAPDVAMTEVTLGSCISTCILLKFIKKISKYSDYNKNNYIALNANAFICIIFLLVFLFSSIKLPKYGDETSPITKDLTKYYIKKTKKNIGINSFITPILASYRAYDSLGETLVIFISGLSTLLLLSKKKSE